MPRQLDTPNAYGGTTDHSDVIESLREGSTGEGMPRHSVIMLNLAADLLEAHDQTGISLDDWPWARQFIEMLTHIPVIPNCV